MFDAVWCVTAQASSPRIAQHCQTSLSCLLLGPPPPRQWPAPWLLNTLTLLLLSFVFLLSVEVGGQLNPRLNIVFCFIGHFPTIFLSRPLNFASMHRYNARIQADRCRQLSIVFTQDNTIFLVVFPQYCDNFSPVSRRRLFHGNCAFVSCDAKLNNKTFLTYFP